MKTLTVRRTLVPFVFALAACAAQPAKAGTAQFLYPAVGQTAVDSANPIQWTSVADADVYFLYVGTTPGTYDVWGTGETTATSILVPPSLPHGVPLWARIWTRTVGVWTYAPDVSIILANSSVASLVYPNPGQTDVSPAQPFRWTAVPDAEVYFLYVGTTPGTYDLWGTGETTETSVLVPTSLPNGVPLWARIWTRRSGSWAYGPDVSFTIARTSVLQYPLDGQTVASAAQPFRWTAVPDAEVYFLYVGTTPGTYDVWGTGETLETSVAMPATLPQGVPLWARIWTLQNGVWTFGPDVAFRLASVAELLVPTASAPLLESTTQFRWTSVDGAEKYFLYVGTLPGTYDVWGTGETTETSAGAPAGLPVGQTLYARIWTFIGGRWIHSGDVPFSVLDRATMIYPGNGDGDVDFSSPFTWNPGRGVGSSRLSVGTSPGLADVFDTGLINQTSVTLPPLAAGVYYGSLWSGVNGVWASWDFTFGSTGSPVSLMAYPTSGASNVDSRLAFRWTTIPNAAVYYLVLGTTAGASNLFDSGELGTTSIVVSPLSPATVTYARLFTKKFGSWRYSDAVFTTGPQILPSLVYPADGAVDADTSRPFEWTVTPLATRYRLEIGTALGGSDLHDSGAIGVVKRFADTLPVGTPLYLRLSAYIEGAWVSQDSRFTVAKNGVSPAGVTQAAFWATDFVRNMADAANVPIANSLLDDLLQAEGFSSAYCTDYAAVLLLTLTQVNIDVPAKILNVCMKPNWYDCHTLVEFQEPLGGTWMLLDPTFDLTARRTADGQWATALDVSQATRTMNFSDVSYQFLGSRGSDIARGYYLDYPLLYLNIYPGGAALDPATAASSLPFMDPVAMPVDSGGPHAIQGSPGAAVGALLDGTEVQFACDPVDGLTYVFWAQSIASLPGSPIQVFRPRRFVF